MAKEGSVAPKERINITYKSSGSGEPQVELPLKILMLGDYTGRKDDRTVEDRKPINVDKDNFADVMRDQRLAVDITVPDKLSTGGAAGDLGMHLDFQGLKDFTPEGIANQVPELRQLLELRNALGALKGPLGNIPAFRKKLQALLGDEGARDKLLAEIGVNDKSGE